MHQKLNQLKEKIKNNKALIGLLSIGAVVGIVGSATFATALEYTNTERFCISCHEMHDNPYTEYKETIHASNRTGVTATCSDCHVPKEFGAKLYRKWEAKRDVLGWITGIIDTPEKFEENRLEMARREWARFKANDSQACRNCHNIEKMVLDDQKQRARRQHETAMRDNMTCIDCHKGIAHHLPDGMTDDDE